MESTGQYQKPVWLHLEAMPTASTVSRAAGFRLCGSAVGAVFDALIRDLPKVADRLSIVKNSTRRSPINRHQFSTIV